MQGVLALVGGRYALQVLQGVLEVRVDKCFRLGANFELVVDGAHGLHFGLGIGYGLADVLARVTCWAGPAWA